MKRVVATKWIKALRSGKYKKTRFRLRDWNGGMCTLGVLCEISRHSEWDDCSYLSSNVNLPLSVQKWAGMRTPNGRLNNYKSISFMNDAGYTFLELADLIEKKWKEL